MTIKVSRDGETVWEFSEEAIPDLLTSAFLRGSDYYWHEGMSDWRRVDTRWSYPASPTDASGPKLIPPVLPKLPVAPEAPTSKSKTGALIATILGIAISAVVIMWILTPSREVSDAKKTVRESGYLLVESIAQNYKEVNGLLATAMKGEQANDNRIVFLLNQAVTNDSERKIFLDAAAKLAGRYQEVTKANNLLISLNKENPKATGAVDECKMHVEVLNRFMVNMALKSVSVQEVTLLLRNHKHFTSVKDRLEAELEAL